MGALISLILGVELPKPYQMPVDICDKDWSQKSLEAKIELAIGCSKVNGRRVYSYNKMERIYGE